MKYILESKNNEEALKLIEEIYYLLDIEEIIDKASILLTNLEDDTNIESSINNTNLYIEYKRKVSRRTTISISYIKSKIERGDACFAWELKDLKNFLGDKINFLTKLELISKTDSYEFSIREFFNSVDDISNFILNLKRLGYYVDIILESGYVSWKHNSIVEILESLKEEIDSYGMNYDDVISGNVDDELSGCSISFEIKYPIKNLEQFKEKIDTESIPKKYIDDFEEFVKKYSVSHQMKKDLIQILKK